jgi:hypothetical protein
MKLFAKRTKKVASSSSTTEAERTVFQSDPIVDALLQQDPSTWNAKQRRMIKRYQDRKQESPEGIETSPAKKQETAEEPLEPSKKEDKEAGEESGEGSDNADSESEDDSSDEEDKADEGEETKEEDVVPEPDASVMVEDATEDAVDDTADPSGQPTTDDDAKNQVVDDESGKKDTDTTAQTIDAELSDMLERLDSKTRRKLRRKLERGEATATEIRQEATALLKPAKEEEKPSVEADSDSPNKGKKRKADWSNLPPEERVRREEQRKNQQEAAARRAAGELPASKFRHPLNSERRRANRRKPKWERPEAKTGGGPANEHNFSGFHMRKVQAASGGSGK